MKIYIMIGAISFALSGLAFAAETTTYEYDAQGRLIKSSKSGGPASGWEKCTSYDDVGNRTNQTVNASGCSTSGGGGSGGGGSGGGGGSNNPPVAVADSIVANCGVGFVHATANDSDPDNDPITAISVTGGMGAYIAGGSHVHVTSAVTGTLTYTIQDSNGATDSATITVLNLCGPFF